MGPGWAMRSSNCCRLCRIHRFGGASTRWLRRTRGGGGGIQPPPALPHPLLGVGIDAVAAQDAWGLGAPGFTGLKLDPAPGKGMNRDCIPNAEAEKYFFHFPDGNASIARLLVRKLIPAAIPGNSAADVVLTKADYSKLDEGSSPVRIRLNRDRKSTRLNSS